MRCEAQLHRWYEMDVNPSHFCWLRYGITYSRLVTEKVFVLIRWYESVSKRGLNTYDAYTPTSIL